MKAKYNGRAGNRRGRAAELRACRLMPDVIDALPWADSWREATPEEDAGGIDLVVDTDAGEVCLQIKASKRNVRRALDRAWWIGVVAVNEHKTDWHVEADLRETLSGQRALRIGSIGGDRKAASAKVGQKIKRANGFEPPTSSSGCLQGKNKA